MTTNVALAATPGLLGDLLERAINLDTRFHVTVRSNNLVSLPGRDTRAFDGVVAALQDDGRAVLLCVGDRVTELSDPGLDQLLDELARLTS